MRAERAGGGAREAAHGGRRTEDGARTPYDSARQICLTRRYARRNGTSAGVGGAWFSWCVRNSTRGSLSARTWWNPSQTALRVDECAGASWNPDAQPARRSWVLLRGLQAVSRDQAFVPNRAPPSERT